MNGLPIVFIHKGDSFYLKYALESAKKFNPKSRIILIGDNVTIYPNFVEYYEMNKFNEYGNVLEKIYVHLNTSNPEIEMFCIKRWLVLLDFMEKQKLKKVFTCDSDVLLFQNVTIDAKNYEKYDFLLANGNSAGLTFINNIKSLEYYKDVVFNFYKQKAKKVDKKLMITDMSFWKQLNDSKKFKVGEATKIVNNAFYDFGFISQNYYVGKNDYGIKKLMFKDGLAFGEINTSLVRLKCIHFQGPTKFYMKDFLKGNNNIFIELKVKSLIWFRDNFSGKISHNARNKIKKLMIKIGL